MCQLEEQVKTDSTEKRLSALEDLLQGALVVAIFETGHSWSLLRKTHCKNIWKQLMVAIVVRILEDLAGGFSNLCVFSPTQSGTMPPTLALLVLGCHWGWMQVWRRTWKMWWLGREVGRYAVPGGSSSLANRRETCEKSWCFITLGVHARSVIFFQWIKGFSQLSHVKSFKNPMSTFYKTCGFRWTSPFERDERALRNRFNAWMWGRRRTDCWLPWRRKWTWRCKISRGWNPMECPVFWKVHHGKTTVNS